MTRLSSTPEYRTWLAINQRCRVDDPNNRWHAARGISVCDRWKYDRLDRSGFARFLADMGSRPSDNHSIDRIDSKGDYGPENCRWATPKQQSRNTSRNNIITLNGKTACLAEHAEDAGIPYSTVCSRIYYGWDIERALTSPVGKDIRRSPTRRINNPVLYEVDGVSAPMSVHCRTYGVSINLVTCRIRQYGWPPEDAFKLPKLNRWSRKSKAPH